MNWHFLRSPVGAGIFALAVLILLASTFAIVPETQQAVILRLERPTGEVVNPYRAGEAFGDTGAGLVARIPFIDRLVWVDKRILDADLANQTVYSTDQQPLQVDAYARYRVVNPLQMVVTARSEQGLRDLLTVRFGAALRAELGQRRFAELLSPERSEVMQNIRERLQRAARQYGVQIIDVRIQHADLPDGAPLTSALERMKSARHLQAQKIAAEGYRDAQLIRGQADAEAARIYAEAYNKDPSFYDFYRAMRSYRTAFAADAPGKGDTTILIGPENDYLRQYEGKSR